MKNSLLFACVFALIGNDIDAIRVPTETHKSSLEEQLYIFPFSITLLVAEARFNRWLLNF